MTVNDASLGESGSKLSKVAATSLLMGVTRASSEAYQISAVLDSEKVIKKTTVDGNRFTRLASRNFRNQLFYYNDAFPAFKELVESTWEELQVNPVETVFVDDGRLLQFFVRVRAFEAELGWMGHGLQMWIQTM